jgi:F0F1-type ATP synthase assembly protein I
VWRSLATVEFVATHRVDPAATTAAGAASRGSDGDLAVASFPPLPVLPSEARREERRQKRAAKLAQRQRLFSGFGDALALSIEFVATPLIFAVAGYFLDRWLGTEPYLMVALGAFAFAGVVARAYYTYLATMEAEEAGKPWTRTKR